MQVIDVKLVNMLVRWREALELRVHNQLVQLEVECCRHSQHEDKTDDASTACHKCRVALICDLDCLTKQVKTLYLLSYFPENSSHAFFSE